MKIGCKKFLSLVVDLVLLLLGKISDQYLSIPLPKVTSEQASDEMKKMSYLSCEITMNFFINMLNNIEKNVKMFNPIYFKKKSAYSYYSVLDRNDIQIFFIYPDENQAEVGHYICTYYDAHTKIVHIYDSCVKLYSDDQKRDIKRRIQEEFLDRMYPKHKYALFKNPKSTQTDNYSCGVFAIAYALLLLQQKDPEYHEIPFLGFDTFFLRQFLCKMFEENKILKFEYFI